MRSRMIVWPMNAAHRVWPYRPPPTLCRTRLLMPTTFTPAGSVSDGWTACGWHTIRSSDPACP